MAHKTLDTAIGKVLKELSKKENINNNELSRLLTIECLKLLPYSDRDYLLFPNEVSDSSKNQHTTITEQDINNYIKNTFNNPNSVITLNVDGKLVEKSLAVSVTNNSVTNFLSGRTSIPSLELMGFCRLFNISYDSLMHRVYNELNIKQKAAPIPEYSLEYAYNIFSKKAFEDQQDNRYVYNTNEQRHLLSSLFLNGKEKEELYFTYLPMNPGLKDKNQKLVIYQRGKLIFEMKDGMCHVTSNVSIGSQGIPSQYKGFAIVMNPKSNGTTCTCFLREVGNTFGVFVLFTFRLSPLDKHTRKTRVSECMAVRRSDGTAFVYRLLISENYIDDEKMNYFAGHLKLCTSENTNEGKELNIVIRKEYISLAKQYFENTSKSEKNNAFKLDMDRHFGNADKTHFLDLINLLETSYTTNDEFIKISPDIFNKKNTEHLLFLGWLGKYGLSARHDKIENSLDDEIENIHKTLYPELHEDHTEDWY